MQVGLADDALAHQLPGQGQGQIHAGEAAGGLVQGTLLFMGGVGGVIGGQDIDGAVLDGPAQGLAVFGAA